jgi:CheY-like chemotaxis protein
MQRFAGKTLLLADDDLLFREVVRDLLESEGARILEAADAEDAWKVLQEHSVDAIISDFQMPRGGGLALLDRFREVNFSAPFALFLTGSLELDRATALDRGADLVFSKPFDSAEWLDSLSRQMSPFGGVQQLTGAPEKAIEVSSIRLGRRGVFLAIPSIPTEIRPGQRLAFRGMPAVPGMPSFPERVQGHGVVRWIREGGKSGASGVGLEVLALTPDCWSGWVDRARLQVLRASIPSGI